MKTSKRKNGTGSVLANLAGMALLVVATIGLMFGASSVQAAVIYSESFSAPWEGPSNDGTDPLNGTTPDVTTDLNSWTAASNWLENGTVVGSDDSGAFLAFTPTTGKEYTLSATFTKPDALNWVALGFAGNNTTSGQEFWKNDTAPWMLWRHEDHATPNEVVSWLGPGATGSESEGQFTGASATFDIVLNTEAVAWTAEWFVNGTSVRAETYGTNPTINHIGLGRDNSAGTTVSDFSLTVIPEPASLGLIGLMGAILLIRRRLYGNRK